MKHQYFGDKRDFFKYDILLTLVEQMSSLEKFLFVPLLTPNDGSNDGSFVDYPANRRKDLHQFLKNCVNHNERNLNAIVDYVRTKSSFNFIPYKFNEYFSHTTREAYFSGINKDNIEIH